MQTAGRLGISGGHVDEYRQGEHGANVRVCSITNARSTLAVTRRRRHILRPSKTRAELHGRGQLPYPGQSISSVHDSAVYWHGRRTAASLWAVELVTSSSTTCCTAHCRRQVWMKLFRETVLYVQQSMKLVGSSRKSFSDWKSFECGLIFCGFNAFIALYALHKFTTYLLI